ncbi:MAG: permease of the major facilitator superfamily [Candidatus Eremiobacteraeota bacterium]|nr:permease of the major facilitator superfamily [Candidatus Eremiobacteraeota bacterium]
MAAFLDRSHSIAGPGFSRWLVPPAALCIHLCIGQAYAFSVFNKPMSLALGVTAPAPGDWTIPNLGWIFSLAIVFLGLSAAVFGRWVESAGPRAAMFAAACLFCGGLIVAGLGVSIHNLPIVYLGYGVIGGCGLGIGYISPVSTLIKWFPDRPGLATGTAIMGFGGGALIGAPLAVLLMKYYSTPTSTGVAPTMITMGLIYFVFMISGALMVRLPAPGWKPAGWVPPTPAEAAARMITTRNVVMAEAVKTQQFWLLWAVLFLNVTAGIGILGQASLMVQDMFGVAVAAAAGFVGLLSLFNMGGRIFWASMSDFIGRKRTYMIFFGLGAILYALIPWTKNIGSLGLFVAVCCIILTMYGGGFATIPAYLRDMFGTVQVGAIHGVLLTAWSAAGIAGPVLVNYIRQYQLDHGVPKAEAYSVTMYIMAVLLVVGFICNYLVRPLDERHYVTTAEAVG